MSPACYGQDCTTSLAPTLSVRWSSGSRLLVSTAFLDLVANVYSSFTFNLIYTRTSPPFTRPERAMQSTCRGFSTSGRPVRNMKKFEEGVFSDLRNLKPGTDACLEEPKVRVFH